MSRYFQIFQEEERLRTLMIVQAAQFEGAVCLVGHSHECIVIAIWYIAVKILRGEPGADPEGALPATSPLFWHHFLLFEMVLKSRYNIYAYFDCQMPRNTISG